MTNAASSTTEPGDRRVEMPPDAPSTLGLWTLLLVGPVVWFTHFMIVYLAAEASCAALETDQDSFIGTEGLTITILVATVVGVGTAAAAAWYSWRRVGDSVGDLAVLSWAGVLLDLGAIVTILAVGLPTLVLDPC